MSLQQGQSQLRSMWASIKVIILLQEGRLSGIEIFLVYPGRHSWPMTVSISSMVLSILGPSSPSGNELFLGLVLWSFCCFQSSSSSLSSLTYALGALLHFFLFLRGCVIVVLLMLPQLLFGGRRIKVGICSMMGEKCIILNVMFPAPLKGRCC